MGEPRVVLQDSADYRMTRWSRPSVPVQSAIEPHGLPAPACAAEIYLHGRPGRVLRMTRVDPHRDVVAAREHRGWRHRACVRDDHLVADTRVGVAGVVKP